MPVHLLVNDDYLLPVQEVLKFLQEQGLQSTLPELRGPEGIRFQVSTQKCRYLCRGIHSRTNCCVGVTRRYNGRVWKIEMSAQELGGVPGESTTQFLKEHRSFLLEKLAGMCAFPMRPLGRDTKDARQYESSVRARFEAKENNLFALSIDPQAYRGVAGREEDELLYRFFILGEATTLSGLSIALGSTWVQEAIGAEFIRVDLQKLHCAFRLVPHDGQLFLSDPYSTASDMVYLSNDSLFMAQLTKSMIEKMPAVTHVVDLGTGSGILACSAAGAKGVPATGIDINARALSFARANAAINGIESQWVEANYAAVSMTPGCFVIANPPFVFTPNNEKSTLHSHGGDYGLGLTLDVLSVIAEKLPGASSFALITQSCVLENEDVPLLVSKCKSVFPSLDICVENVGTMPLLAKYEDFYRQQGVTAIHQLVLSGSRGWGDVLYEPKNAFAGEVCFG